MFDSIKRRKRPVDLSPIEIIQGSDLPEVFSAINQRRRNAAGSYGAFLVPIVNEQDLQIAKERLLAIASDAGSKVKTDTIGEPDGQSIPRGALHFDPADSDNSITLWHGVLGVVDVAIIVGGSKPDDLRRLVPAGLDYEQASKAMRQITLGIDLLGRGIYSGEHDRILKDTVEPGGLLVFDHSQPHVFQAQTAQRLTMVEYIS